MSREADCDQDTIDGYELLTNRLSSSESAVSIYIHVPFCQRKCDYCSFYSVPLNAYECSEQKRLKRYFLERMIEDIRHFFSNYQGRVDTVYVGGGDPGQLDPKELKLLLGALKLPNAEQHGALQLREVTIELNPEHIIPNYLEELAESGVTRFSFGIQSCSRSSRAYIGRKGTLDRFIKHGDFLKNLQKKKNIAVNTDIIASIPYQTAQDAMHDIDFVIETAEPKHISLYDLSIENGTPLAEKIQKENNRDLSEISEDLLSRAWDYLAERDYEQYEISNFCREEAVSLHNMNYWNMNNFIGFGPGAVSSVFQDGRSFRFSSGSSLNHYIRQGSSYGAYEEIDRMTSLKEYMMMQLRTVKGADMIRAEKIFGKKIESLVAELLNSRRISDMIQFESGTLRLKPGALLLYNTVIREIFTCIDDIY